MLQNIPVINFLIFAAGLGFISAIIYTNIQRDALSRLINGLIDNKCFDEKSAKTLDELGISGIYASIARSAVKKQYGIKKIVRVTDTNNNQTDSLENLLAGKKSARYVINSDCDIELAIKKYSYKPLTVKILLLLTAAIIAVVVLCAFLTDKIIENTVISQRNSGSETETAQSDEQNSSSETDTKDSDDQTNSGMDSTNTVDDKSSENTDGNNSGEISTPRLPT